MVLTSLLVSLYAAEAGAVPLYYTPDDDVPTGMQDLDIGADGDVFAVAAGSSGAADGALYQWLHDAWVPFGGQGTRVAVDGYGRPWRIDGQGRLYRWTSVSWSRISGVVAQAIDIGGGAVFILRDNGAIARYVNGTFVDFGGYAQEISVDRNGRPWVVSSGSVWSHDGYGWRRHLSFTARDIDAGADGTIYALGGGSGANGYVYRYDANADRWVYNGGYGTRIAVAPTGAPALVNSYRDIWSNFVRRIHGDASCTWGQRDCNMCAFDVRGQFRAALGYGHKTGTHRRWDLNWTSTYSPAGLTPRDPFDDSLWPTSAKHVQGFVRTGSTQYPYAGSYSDDTFGSVFVTRRYAPNSRLANIHVTGSDTHPSGVHALGHFIGTNESGRLRIYDVENSSNTRRHTVPAPDPDFMKSSGGGLGLARLGPSEYLMVSTNPGGNAGGLRRSHFWRVDGALDSASPSLTYVGGGVHQLPWASGFDHNENVTLITECETGQIYGVHSWGDPELYGQGYWRVSRLEQGPSGPVFRGLDGYSEGQNADTCHHRAAATAFVDASNEITTYCHEYDARYEWPETWEGVDFTERAPNYSNSCVQSCGGRAPGGCWCDAVCVSAGDCCNDEAVMCQR